MPRIFLSRVAGVLTTIALTLGSSHVVTAEPKTIAPGDLLTQAPLKTAAALPSAASNALITYLSEGAQGQPIVVSGTVAIPKSPPPAGGYPVISWAHGTSGYADICAPSADTDDGPDHDYFALVDNVLDAWVAKGYVVVQTDYEGLGTPGGHTYMSGVSQANTVTDIVRAARQLNPAVGPNWVAIGHSQGGQAVLFTAEYGQARAPGLHLKGVVAIAPGGAGLADTVKYIRAGGPSAEAAENFLPIILLGAQAADPAIDVGALLTPEAQPLLTVARTGCLAQLRQLKTIPPKQVFRADANIEPLTTYLSRQDPMRATPKVPTLIAQGTTDVLVTLAGTNALVNKLCKETPVDYRTYANKDHRGSVAASFPDAVDFVTHVMANQPTRNACEAEKR